MHNILTAWAPLGAKNQQISWNFSQNWKQNGYGVPPTIRLECQGSRQKLEQPFHHRLKLFCTVLSVVSCHPYNRHEWKDTTDSTVQYWNCLFMCEVGVSRHNAVQHWCFTSAFCEFLFWYEPGCGWRWSDDATENCKAPVTCQLFC